MSILLFTFYSSSYLDALAVIFPKYTFQQHLEKFLFKTYENKKKGISR